MASGNGNKLKNLYLTIAIIIAISSVLVNANVSAKVTENKLEYVDERLEKFEGSGIVHEKLDGKIDKNQLTEQGHYELTNEKIDNLKEYIKENNENLEKKMDNMIRAIQKLDERSIIITKQTGADSEPKKN